MLVAVAGANALVCYPRQAWRTLLISLAVGLVGYLLTAPSAAPFHRGGALGQGIALGALAAGIAYALVRLDAPEQPLIPMLAVPTIAGWLLYLHRSPSCPYQLEGFLVGWCSVPIVLAVLARDHARPHVLEAVLVSTVVTAVLVLYLFLSYQKSDDWHRARLWATMGISMMSSALVVGALAQAWLCVAADDRLIPSLQTLEAVLLGLISVLMVSVLALELGFFAREAQAIVGVAVAAAGGLLLWRFLDTQARSAAWSELAVAVLILLAVIAPTMHALAGTGAAFACLVVLLTALNVGDLLVARPVRSITFDRPVYQTNLAVAAMPVVALLAYRAVMSSGASELSSGYLEYVRVVTCVVACLVPGLLGRYMARSRGWTVTLGLLLAMLWPAVVLALWPRVRLDGMIVGLGLSSLLVSAQGVTTDQRRWTVLLSLAGLVILVAGWPVLDALAGVSRLIRGFIVCVALGVAVFTLGHEIITPPAKSTQTNEGA